MKKNKTIILALFSTMILTATISSCKKDDEKVKIEEPAPVDANLITAETVNLKGEMYGTLLAGKTYFLTGDLIIPENKEIVAQAGVTVIAQGDGGAIGPEITVHGSFISLGTQAAPNLFSVPADKRIPANVFAGLWGGFQCKETAKLLCIKWTRMEYLGGEGGPGTPSAGDPRYGINTLSSSTEVVLEDSWVYGSVDDVYRPNGGKINLVRNTFEFCGRTGGDGLNVKSGTVGNISYNVFYGAATNAFKPSNEGDGTVQTNIMVYNNTVINSGWRRPGMSRGANINFEVGARGGAYNNIIVNCKRGIRALADADLPNIKFDNNLYYATFQQMVDEFIPKDAVASTNQVSGSNNKIGAVKANDPKFVNYNVDQFTYEQYGLGENQPTAMNSNSGANLRLASGSPCIGAGTTNFTPVAVTWVHAVGDRAPTLMAPNVDLGAYPTNGTGNKHF